MSKIHALLYAAALVLAVFFVSACGEDPAVTSPESKASPAPADEPAAESVREIAALHPPDDHIELAGEIVEDNTLRLSWDEVNPGDYNGDSTVNGQDVFMLAAHFGHESNYNGHTATDEYDDCIDGNMDGNIDGSDIFLIAANFESAIDGYFAYRAVGQSGPWVLINPTPVDRIDEFAGCQPSYVEDFPGQPDGAWWFIIRAWEEVSGEAGPNSNAVTLTIDTSVAFVGSQACVCHSAKQTSWRETGHPHELNIVEGASPPDYPYSSVPDPPPGYGWDTIPYVVGGYGWRVNFLNEEGYLITGPQAQYSIQTTAWTAYHDGEVLEYDCGACHTTGFNADAPPHMGLPGIVGDWFEAGVGCEACHGPGGEHITSMDPDDINGSPDSDVCGGCHYRDEQHRIEADGGFILSRSQYDEFSSTTHGTFMECSTCHDTHYSAHYDPDNAIIMDCASCHTGKTLRIPMGDQIDCIDCHMPRMDLSAESPSLYEADVRAHLWRINTADGASQFYEEDLKTFSNAWITPEYACLSCHDDENPAWARELAVGMHDPPPEGAYVGSENCFCHPQKQAQWDNTGHAGVLNLVEGASPPDYPYSEVPSPPPGNSWDDVLYVSGGYGWKARFIDQDGYLFTGPNTQYNLETSGWSDYADGETVPYDCGSCHTTGYNADAPSHMGLPGMVGDWNEGGVGCEACHGPGKDHTQSMSKDDIIGQPGPAVCGGCHTRDAEHLIKADGSFILNNTQYDEFLASPHGQDPPGGSCSACHPAHGGGPRETTYPWQHSGEPAMTCSTCHEPHLSTRYGEVGAVKWGCDSCHGGRSNLPEDMQDLECTDCHMPKLVKGAVQNGPFEADMPSHLFWIALSPDAEQFYEEGGQWYSYPYITPPYMCLPCHDQEDEEWAYANAPNIH